MKTKLTPEIMQAFGFTASWPEGNPVEPWWISDRTDVRFTKLPTGEEFVTEFVDNAIRKYRTKQRRLIREALDI